MSKVFQPFLKNRKYITSKYSSLFPPSMSLKIRRTSRTTQGFIEPLLQVEDAVPLRMVLIPGGNFIMGAPLSEIDSYDDERPQHKVTVPSFFMAQTPITKAQWEIIAAYPSVDRALQTDYSEQFSWHGSSDNADPNHPVVGVDWDDATEFCKRLSQWTSRPYRLPTEAEWEYACRADSTTPFYFGETIASELANYKALEAYGPGKVGGFREETTPVGQFPANGFGLHDMHGNVFEWCMDRWNDNYGGAPSDGNAWMEVPSIQARMKRIARGGSWYTLPKNCRSAVRNGFDHGERSDDIGFRVCCSAPRAFQ